MCQNATDYMNFKFDYQLKEKCGGNPLIKSRNEAWLKIIPELLNNNPCFIAVGLLHLYGDCGLIIQLRNRGYSVKPVYDLATL